MREEIYTYCIENPGKVEAMSAIKVCEQIGIGEINTCNDLYDYVEQVKEEDKDTPGVVPLKEDYLLGKLGNNNITNITHYLDIRQVLSLYGTQVLVLRGARLKQYLVDTLIRNGVYLVDAKLEIDKCLTREDLNRRKFGIYSRMERDISYGIYYNFESRQESKARIPLDIMSKMDYAPRENTSAVFCALRSYLFDGIGYGDFGLLPCSKPDKGMVICVFPPLKHYSEREMLDRAVYANLVRNSYMSRETEWYQLDPEGKQVGYRNRIILPERSRFRGNNYYKWYGMEDHQLYDEKYEYNELVMIRAVLKELEMVDNNILYFVNILKNWASGYLSLPVRVWYRSGFNLSHFFDRIRDGIPRCADEISIAHRRIEMERETWPLRDKGENNGKIRIRSRCGRHMCDRNDQMYVKYKQRSWRPPKSSG